MLRKQKLARELVLWDKLKQFIKIKWLNNIPNKDKKEYQVLKSAADGTVQMMNK